MANIVFCQHCEREFETRLGYLQGPCPGCEELGHVGNGPNNCPACQADRMPLATESRPSIGKAIEDSRPVPGTDLHEVRVALNDPAKQTLLSTLAGLKTIAGTPYGQKAAEDLLLSYLGDAEITAAYEPFARKQA